jgi:hypothetical protein
MEQLVFAIYDTKAKQYQEPFFARTVEVAIRSFKRAVNQQGTAFNEFPDDFILFQIGSWDSESAVLISTAPHSLGQGLAFLNPVGPQLLGDDEG